MSDLLTIHRRNLHKIPELEDNLPETKKYILSQLKKLDCKLIEVINSGVAAYFDKGCENTLCFRTDMDALPIEELNTFDFKSTHQGKMHACGHDGHMAMSLVLAEYVNKAKLDNNILIIFQPAEETPGGAEGIVNTGIFDTYNVKAVFGMHLWPGLPVGTFTTKPGPMMPKNVQIDIKIKGKSVHAAKAKEGIDSLYIGSRFVNQIYHIRDEFLKRETVLLQICTFQSGSAFNIVPQEAFLSGTMRAFSEETSQSMEKEIEQLAASLEKEFGCTIELSFSKGYPPVINDGNLYALAKPIAEKTGKFTELKETVMISEDFSYYALKRPALFFFLGSGMNKPLHSSDFNIDEKALDYGCRLFKNLCSLNVSSLNEKAVK